MREFWEEARTIIIGVPLLWIGMIGFSMMGGFFENFYGIYLLLIFGAPAILYVVIKCVGIWKQKQSVNRDS